jgi:ribosomal protein S18 acetylase RimI-like enzyme
MIREYNKTDIDSLIALFHIHHEMSEIEKQDKKAALENQKDLYVYEVNDEIVGMCALQFWVNDEIGQCADLTLSVNEEANFEETSEALWRKAWDIMQEKQVIMLMTHYNEADTRWSRFFENKGFQTWFSVYGMIYKGERFPSHELAHRNYEDVDFDLYYQNLGACFSEMREDLDIKPYDLYRAATNEKLQKYRETTLKQKDRIYLYFDQGQIVGTSLLLDEDIEDVFVFPEYQGKGYGRKIMEASINLMYDLGREKITLGVVGWNRRAINLYQSLGFEKYRCFVHKRLFIK